MASRPEKEGCWQVATLGSLPWIGSRLTTVRPPSLDFRAGPTAGGLPGLQDGAGCSSGCWWAHEKRPHVGMSNGGRSSHRVEARKMPVVEAASHSSNRATSSPRPASASSGLKRIERAKSVGEGRSFPMGSGRDYFENLSRIIGILAIR